MYVHDPSPSYANGPSFYDHYYSENGQVLRTDLNNVDQTKDPDYLFPSAGNLMIHITISKSFLWSFFMIEIFVERNFLGHSFCDNNIKHFQHKNILETFHQAHNFYSRVVWLDHHSNDFCHIQFHISFLQMTPWISDGFG